MEFGHNIIKLFAAIAPMLGLLGTVTGMIKTFEAISLFGGGDPKLMAAGISEALVCTVLGLLVAVPLLFGHNIVTVLAKSLIQRWTNKAPVFLRAIWKKAVLLDTNNSGAHDMYELVHIHINIAHIFALGGPMMWALLVVCLVLWLLMVERFWFLRFSYPALRAIVAALAARADRHSWRAKGYSS
jgi:biopolymer transport protein ExbB/TolQ